MFYIWIFCFTIIYFFKFVYPAVQCELKNVTIELPTIVPTLPLATYSIDIWFGCKQDTQLYTNKIVHLMIHGYTYDHKYWSFPYHLPNYSYVGYVIEDSNILNIDRIGVGLSLKPSFAIDVALDSNANVIYQLTKNLYQRNQYITRWIVAGWLHILNPIGASAVIISTSPAQLDSKFKQQAIPFGYLTADTTNNTQQNLFYNKNNADPDAIALDEQ